MRRRDDPWDKPWVTIASVVGVIAVVIIALVYFMGAGNTAGNPGGQTAAAQSTSALVTKGPTGSAVPSTTSPGTSINPESIRNAPAETVPGTGAFVKVSYIGGFAGTYGINGEMVTLRSSGERVLPLNAAGTVSAAFHKEDGSTRHEIVVEIYKDGKVLKSARNSSAYGEVSVNAQV
jgi:hypothetical protein